MSEEEEVHVPEGAAVFPLIPEELGVHPLLLSVLHSTVFLSGSTEEVVHHAAADEALDYVIQYLERLEGPQLRQIQEDMKALLGYAKQEQWSKQLVEALKAFRDLYEQE